MLGLLSIDTMGRPNYRGPTLMPPGVIGYLDSFLFGFVFSFLFLLIGGLTGVLFGLKEQLSITASHVVLRYLFTTNRGIFVVLLVLILFVFAPLCYLFYEFMSTFHYSKWGLPTTYNDFFFRLGLFFGWFTPIVTFFVYLHRHRRFG